MCRSSGCNLLSEFESKNSNKNVENAFSVTNKFGHCTLTETLHFDRMVDFTFSFSQKCACIGGLWRLLYPQAIEVWPLNPLKCLKYKITLALRSYCYVHYRKPYDISAKIELQAPVLYHVGRF